MAKIDKIMNALETAEDASAYAEAVRCEVEQIGDTDFRLIWTDAYQGDYPPRTE